VRPVIAADVYDGHHTNAKEITKGAILTTRDYHEVLSRKDVDAVVIATPDHWHHRMTLDAFDAGKHVYVEKPMTWSIEQGREMVAATAKSGKLLMVGSGAKTSPLTTKAREIVKSGVLGKINMVRMLNHRNNAEGAWVYAIPPDASPKTVDWTRFLGNAPKRAYDPKYSSAGAAGGSTRAVSPPTCSCTSFLSCTRSWTWWGPSRWCRKAASTAGMTAATCPTS